jgi:hypothetical protein
MRPLVFAVVFLAGLANPTLMRTATAQQAVVDDVSGLDAIVESVDQHDRTVLLRAPDGLSTVKLGPKVKNLAQLKVGDHVHIRLREALVARLTTASPAAVPQTSSEVMTAKPGQKPAGFQRNSIRANVRITGIDLPTHLVKFVGPAGIERVAHLQNPSMQAMLEKLKVGDVVEMTYSTALAVVVTPSGG